MQKMIKDCLAFSGTWRSYQKRVLDRADKYMADKRIHIVAAPGSGKTTLGIELIRRLNAPALILSPSINIRNQWVDRIKEAFLPEDTEDCRDILSTSLRSPAVITSITYQALYVAMSGKEEGDDSEEQEKIDVVKVLQDVGVKTICLDEAHHLRSEWWKSLEELVKDRKDLTVISLTATPPYDSTKAEWERYIGLCGPIDEEIIVPELVKEGSLCPHQDYVYFNMPTKEETQAVTAFRQDAVLVGEQIYEDPEFARMVSTHAGILNPRDNEEALLDRPEYLSSLLVFLNAKGIPFSKELVHMLGAGGKIPAMNLHWLEILLQGFLYDDVDSFASDTVYREQLIALLKGHGLIQKNKVGFTVNDQVNKLMTMSKGKISSIVDIVGAEYENLGSDLRLLILTDYIKKEYLPALGDETKSVNELGVVPIFENIRREYQRAEANAQSDKRTDHKKVTAEDLRLAALSGSVVLIPASAREELEDILAQRQVKASLKECSAPGYFQVTVSGSDETASGLVTELFNRGAIRVLIGTKSLLGEGWDSPCINSLILASFVGSFMLSNQMRGRAIRTMKGNPNKVSNIWHLICMEPENISDKTRSKWKNMEESEDFQTLKRRFECFLGVHYEEDMIENGLERLSVIQPPFTKARLDKINEKMLKLAADRPKLKKRWEDSMKDLHQMDIAVEAGADREYFKPGVLMVNACVLLILCVAGFLLTTFQYALPLLDTLVSGKEGSVGIASALLYVGSFLAIIFLFLIIKFAGRVANMATPFRYMKSIGKGILRALQKTGNIETTNVSVGVEQEDGLYCFTYLQGGTEREKDVYAQCVYEMFGVVDNQRYLLKAKKRVPRLCKYYCVPELFGKKKEDAQLFVSCLEKQIGPYELIYTRNGKGRQVLLEARVHSFANKNDRIANKRKKVKSAWE